MTIGARISPVYKPSPAYFFCCTTFGHNLNTPLGLLAPKGCRPFGYWSPRWLHFYYRHFEYRSGLAP